MSKVRHISPRQIIEAQNIPAHIQKPISNVAANETSGTRNQSFLTQVINLQNQDPET
jgi:hypothetical protein